MYKDRTKRMEFGTPVIAALVSTTLEVMTIPIPARKQENGFIVVTFSDIGTGDVVCTECTITLGAEAVAFDDFTLACGTYVTPSIIFPFNPSKNALFSGPTVTLSFKPTGTLGTDLPGCTAQVIYFPIDGPMPPAADLGTQRAAVS